MQVAPRQLQQLRQIFGDCIPKENAAALVASSPLAPTSTTEVAALREAALALAGQKLDVVSGVTTTGAPAAQRPLPAALSLQLTQVQASKDLRTADGLLKLLSPQKTAQVFRDAAAMKDIPWNFLEEGCVHRSHVLAKRLEEQGVYCEKVFTIPRGGDLIMNSDKARLGFTVCWYHEAVCVHTLTPEGPQRMVIDPSVGDEPMSVAAWLSTMEGTGGASLETFYLPRFAYGLGARDNPPDAWVDDEIQTALAWGDTWQETEQQLLEMNFYDELAVLAGRAPTATAPSHPSAPTDEPQG